MSYDRDIDENFDNFYFMNGQAHAIYIWGLSRLGVIDACKEPRISALFTNQMHSYSLESMTVIFYAYKYFLQFPLGSILEKEMLTHLMTEQPVLSLSDLPLIRIFLCCSRISSRNQHH